MWKYFDSDTQRNYEEALGLQASGLAARPQVSELRMHELPLLAGIYAGASTTR